MKGSPDSTGLLREKLAARELAEARTIADRQGLGALLDHAITLDRRAVADEQRIAAMTASLDHEPRRSAAIVEAFLRETVTDPKALAADLAELSRGRANRLNAAVLAERTTAGVFRLELACESALAVLRLRIRENGLPALRIADVVSLARRPGRWARRVEALGVLRAMTRHALPVAELESIAAACVELASPAQHRWVQAPALEVLARLFPSRALQMMCERFAGPPSSKDDFLVRERIVDLAARLRRRSWHVVLELGAADPSEHVRIAVARVDRDPIRLAHAATSSSSEKVRATALMALAKRRAFEAVPTLVAALGTDPSPLVVTTAAAGLTLLARRKVLRARKLTQEAIHRAAGRAELPEHARAAVLEELLAVSVLSDPYLRLVYDLLANVVAEVPVGGGVRVVGRVLSALTDEQMGQVLGALARDDFAISADRVGDGFVIYRGERRAFALWRWLFELRHPHPSKRQGYDHTWGRVMRGRLRAPPQGLAELTATGVPGERVVIGSRGDWGRHVPLVEDLVQSGLFSGAPTHIIGASGTTVITPPASLTRRALAKLRLTMQYAYFAEQRRRSLGSDEVAVQRGYLEAVARTTGIRMDFKPHHFAEGLSAPPELAAAREPPTVLRGLGPAVLAAPALQTLDGVVRDFLHYAVRPEGNRLPHVGAYAAAILVAMLARSVMTRRSIDSDRKSIPLVVGGWGTRGKSGTERLKAGLFHGLGYEVLVKTTGCEAMFIHGVPGLPAHEVFLYRPYDKATIWEQRDVLALGRKFGVRVFMWECMALQPDLVNLLSAQWMRDDYSTITNAYPDHEDVQGPAGYDVAQVIGEFIPPHGRLFTTEDQMLPLLRESAKSKRTSVRAVGEREAALLGDDVLARFPYHEHPKNIALVSALAQALGVPAAVALAEMADNVVPDLGVLKTYPRVRHAGRSMAFTNGMSANERTGALSNWLRMGFDEHDAEREPARWVVTVVNNRADRVARSEVFARFVVQDIGAHKHVLIGTNVSGLLGFLREALEKHLAAIAPTRELDGDLDARRATVLARLDRAFKSLKVAEATTPSVCAEMAALGLRAIDPNLIERLLQPVAPGEAFAAARRAVEGAIAADYPRDARRFVVSAIARRRLRRAVLVAVDLHLEGQPALVDRVFNDAYRALFEEQVVALHDATLTGDQIIDVLASQAPPGATIDVMGLQNIKGTGLDFVYRWVSLEAVDRALSKVRSASAEEAEAGVRALLVHDDYGLVDAAHALGAVRELRALSAPALAARLDAVIARLTPIVARRTAALSATRTRSTGDVVRGVIGKTFDYLDSMRRQAMARHILEDLIAGRVSHAGAAAEMRNVVARAKGAWAAKRMTLEEG